ncbi:MAG TPA: hypothetical protein VH986_00185 [Acidimicrobiia bacterium]
MAGGLHDLPRSRIRYLNQLASPGTSPATLGALSTHEDVAVRVVCGAHESTPEPALRNLAKDPRREVRQAVATNASAPRAIARRLTRDPVHDVAVAAARNPALGRPYLTWLLAVRRTNASLCRAAALNPVARHAQIRLALTNARWDVRRNAVRHANITSAQLTRQSRSPFWAVRAEVATNPSTPSAILRRLAHDIPPVVLVVAGSPLTPSWIVDQLLGHESPFIRGVAAGNVNASAEALAHLGASMSEDPWILRRIARNANTPSGLSSELLAWLALGGAGEGDPDFDPVRCTGNPPDAQGSADRWYRTRAETVDRPELDPLWRTRAASSALRGKGAQLRLRILARDAHTEGRWAAARFPALDYFMLRELTHDENPSVAATARWSMDKPNDQDETGLARYRRGIRLTVAVVWPLLLAFFVLLAVGAFRSTPSPSVHTPTTTVSPPTVTVPGSAPPQSGGIGAKLAFSRFVKGGVPLPAPAGSGSLPGGGWLAAVAPVPGSAALDLTVQAGNQPIAVDYVELQPRGGQPTKVFRVLALEPNSMLIMHYSGQRQLARVRVHYLGASGPGIAATTVPGA